MKTNDKIIMGIFAVMIVTLLAVRAAEAFPFGTGMMGNMHSMNFNSSGTFNITQMNEFHTSIQNAIDNKDFNAWKSLMISQLTQEHFNHIVAVNEQRNETHNGIGDDMDEMHDKMMKGMHDGNFTQVKELHQEFHGMGGMMRGNMHQQMHGFKKFDAESSQ